MMRIFRPKIRFLRVLHQTAGVIGALIILMMSVTGLLLNHPLVIGYSTTSQIQLQKLIFAVHSGSVGRTSIVWLTDLGAICMIVLSITGLWLWFTVTIRRTWIINRK